MMSFFLLEQALNKMLAFALCDALSMEVNMPSFKWACADNSYSGTSAIISAAETSHYSAFTELWWSSTWCDWRSHTTFHLREKTVIMHMRYWDFCAFAVSR